ncbi:MAG: hypothetical protein MI864_00325 [Pseudomonadales bacterium]|nr:hypothetical protein [Pseudomonadales bacterium]
MSIYTRLDSTAARLLAAYGQEVIFSREIETGFNPATGVPTTSSTTVTITAVSDNYSSAVIDGTTIKEGDVKLYASASVVPLVGDKSTKYGTILAVKPVEPGGVAVLYELHCRP